LFTGLQDGRPSHILHQSDAYKYEQAAWNQEIMQQTHELPLK